jgi:hypothetical protein
MSVRRGVIYQIFPLDSQQQLDESQLCAMPKDQHKYPITSFSLVKI